MKKKVVKMTLDAYREGPQYLSLGFYPRIAWCAESRDEPGEIDIWVEVFEGYETRPDTNVFYVIETDVYISEIFTRVGTVVMSNHDVLHIYMQLLQRKG